MFDFLKPKGHYCGLIKIAKGDPRLEEREVRSGPLPYVEQGNYKESDV